jgi:hypothetical protein
MKKQKKKSRDLHLQTNKRWKWMAGATAAGMTASQASATTITLIGNFISATGGNHLNADLTGDGHPDLTISGAFYRHSTRGGTTYTSATKQFFTASANLTGVHARAYFTGGNLGLQFGSAQLGTQHEHGYPYPGLPVLTGSIPITFTDSHINGGGLTKGLLNVTVSTYTVEVQLDSLTYDTRAVPDQGSSLALLALGAGGVLALRRWRTAKGSVNPTQSVKTKSSNYRRLYHHTRDNRWKWMAGATAATAAGVTASQASIITINLDDNTSAPLVGTT